MSVPLNPERGHNGVQPSYSLIFCHQINCIMGPWVLVCEAACRVHCPPCFPAPLTPSLPPRRVLSSSFSSSLVRYWEGPWRNSRKQFSWELFCHWPLINQLSTSGSVNTHALLRSPPKVGPLGLRPRVFTLHYAVPSGASVTAKGTHTWN